MIFTKMQSLGNDFLILNCFDEVNEIDEKLPVTICDRHFGIGADGLALVLYSNDADIKVDFYSPDGIKTVCNTNLLRCVAKYALDNKIVNKSGNALPIIAIWYIANIIELNKYVTILFVYFD